MYGLAGPRHQGTPSYVVTNDVVESPLDIVRLSAEFRPKVAQPDSVRLINYLFSHEVIAAFNYIFINR